MPRQLQTLGDLLAQAQHNANYSLQNSVRVPLPLFLICTDGPAVFISQNLPDNDTKDDFATTARLVCIAHASTAMVMTFEAWTKATTLD